MADAEIPAPWSGLEARWLAHEELGARHGAAIQLVVPPGASYATHRLAGSERVFYLVQGEGAHFGSGGALALQGDDVLVLDPEAWHGFENSGDTPAVVWLAWAPGSHFDQEGYEELGDADAGADHRPLRRRLKGAGEDPATTPEERGFHNLGVIWDGAEGAEAITLGWGHFEQRALHEMHRHHFADEVMFVEEGAGFHLTPGNERELVGPTFQFVPAEEWHSLEVRSGRLEGMFFYLGAAGLDATGYELESQAATPSGEPRQGV